MNRVKFYHFPNAYLFLILDFSNGHSSYINNAVLLAEFSFSARASLPPSLVFRAHQRIRSRGPPFLASFFHVSETASKTRSDKQFNGELKSPTKGLSICSVMGVHLLPGQEPASYSLMQHLLA